MPLPAFAVGGLLEIGKKLIDRLIPDKAAAAEAHFKLLEMEQNGQLAELAATTQLAQGQLEINKVEAASTNPFVAGWRPAVGWTCVAALSFQYVIGPLGEWLTGLAGLRVTWPMMNTGELMTLLIGMLGLGALRTTEKVKGVSA